MSFLQFLQIILPTKFKTIKFVESKKNIPNPERGWYVGYDLPKAGDATRIAAAGRRLVGCFVMLETMDILFLASLVKGFSKLRTAGLKCILRFRYNSDGGGDVPKAVMLRHVTELSMVLNKNADVIALIQMGMVGAWGEGHDSTNGLDNDEDRSDILNEQLKNWPGFICVRTPAMKKAYIKKFGEVHKERIGFFDDCYLGSQSDMGTYRNAEEQEYFDKEDTPVGGETCALFPSRTDGKNALIEMIKDRLSYLNAEYNEAVLGVWAATGYYAEVEKRLGYRLVLQSATITKERVTVKLINKGFAGLFKSRSVYLVFRKGEEKIEKKVGIDTKTWRVGIGIEVEVDIGGWLGVGVWRVGLWLPDGNEGLRMDARYAVRCANDGVWNEETGENVLGEVKII